MTERTIGHGWFVGAIVKEKKATNGNVPWQAMFKIHLDAAIQTASTKHLTEWQLDRDSQTCMDTRYVRTSCTERHGLDGEPPLARNCTETMPNKVNAPQPCHRVKNTNNTLVQRQRQFV